MGMNKATLAAQGATSGFVLLWGSAAIFSRMGLDNASPLILLVMRFAVALATLVAVSGLRKTLLPASGTRINVALTGLMLIGGYSVCYFKAMSYGITPGAIATMMGIQPVLTLCLTERRFSGRRLCGLLIALAGLILMVWQSLTASALPVAGVACALAALGFITFGTLLQKQNQQAPAAILPMQYAVSLMLCLLLLPTETFRLHRHTELVISVLFLGVLISVVAQLLFYRLLSAGSIVNVTSLFYLVPAIAAVLDYALLGNRLPVSGIAGMAAILLGVMLVFRAPRATKIRRMRSSEDSNATRR